MLQFWSRVVDIYGHYKFAQVFHDKYEGHHPQIHHSGVALSPITGLSMAYWVLSVCRLSQVRIGIVSQLIRDSSRREELVEKWWDEEHERNSDKMLKLCLDLRGFYLKGG